MIYVQIPDIWEYYEKHKADMWKSEYLVAESDDGHSIYVTDEKDVMVLNVYDDIELVMTEEAINKDDAIEIYCKVLAAAGIKQETIGDTDDDSHAEEIDDTDDDSYAEEIEANECRLKDAAQGFLYEVVDGFGALNNDAFDSMSEALVEIACKLAHNHGFDVFRPMMLEDKNGRRFYSEYPYPEMD